MFDPSRISLGPGTLYAAPLGTAEPQAVTGAWPAGWLTLGYTDAGSTFSYNPSFAAVTVEEELDVIDNVPTGRTVSLAFALAEITAANLLLVYNGGVGPAAQTAGIGTFADGSRWVEPVDLGLEQRVMLGWDELPKGATSGPAGGLQRLIVRKCLQTGTVSQASRKGATKKVYSATFSGEKPFGIEPFRHIFPPQLAA